MPSLKFLHTADVHIGAANGYLGHLASRRQRETVATFRRMAQHCHTNSIPLMLIAGDLFDSNKIDTSLVSEVFGIFSEYSSVKFVFAAGNHDPLSSDSPFLNEKLPENVFVLSTENDCIFLEELSAKIYGCSFKSVFEGAFEGFNADITRDTFNIAVLHGELLNSSSDYRFIDTEKIEKSGMDYIALGHVHLASPVKKAGNTAYAYSGCPEGQGFDELGEKGAWEIQITDGVLKSKFIPFAVRQHLLCRVDISGAVTTEMVISKVLNHLKENYGEDFSNNLYKIELVGKLPSDFTLQIHSVLAGLSPLLFFVKLKNSTEKEIDYTLIAREHTLRGIFVKKMLNRIETAKGAEVALLKKALVLGLNAFENEVDYDEN